MLPATLSGVFPSPRPGPYKDIGFAFISTPAAKPFTRQSPRFKENGHPALSLRDIGYAVFYPASPPKSSGWFGAASGRVDWLARPKEQLVEGYKRFLGDRAYWVLVQSMKAFMTRMQFSAYHTAPLLPPSPNKLVHPPAPSSSTSQTASQSSLSSSSSLSSKYPLIIFSHGLAGTRTTYSQYCQALASEGYVVLSIEHKDGSGPAVQVQEGAGDGEGWLHYTRHQDLEYDNGQDPSLMAFRTMQLDLRVQEVYEAYHSFKSVVSGDMDPAVHESSADEGKAFVSSVRNRVDVEDVSLTGHSFGGATVLSILQTPPPASLPPIPIKHAIALDPWLEPVPSPAKHEGGHPSYPPLLVANSPGFTIWNGHFERLARLVDDARGWLVTVMNGSHQSFSDFPLLLPPAAKSVKYLHLTHELSVNFLKGTLSESEIIKGLEADAGKVDRDDKGKMSFKGDVALHLRGEA